MNDKPDKQCFFVYIGGKLSGVKPTKAIAPDAEKCEAFFRSRGKPIPYTKPVKYQPIPDSIPIHVVPREPDKDDMWNLNGCPEPLLDTNSRIITRRVKA